MTRKIQAKGFSIFIFIADKYIDSYKEKDFLRKYGANMNFERIENVFKSDNVKTIRKKHPDRSDKKESFKRWCEDLFKKIKSELLIKLILN